MTRRLAGTMTAIAAILLLAGGPARAQPDAPPPPPITVQTSPEQLEDLLAPIALYPDPLLSQILMASSYPVEVVQAARWLQDPGAAALRGVDLVAAVEPQNWDPSVKSLVVFPRILQMMDAHLDWMETLGEAFAANPAAVMDAVQDLRRRAVAAGALRSTATQVVSDEGGIITVEPAAPQEVAYPAYDPQTAYGPWPYPDYPPYAFDDFADGCVVGDFGYCWYGVAIVGPLWGWNHWDWRGHRLLIEPGRFAGLNNHRPPASGAVWAHERGHRHGVPYMSSETRARYPAAAQALDLGASTRGPPTVTGARGPGSSAPGGGVPASPRISHPALSYGAAPYAAPYAAPRAYAAPARSALPQVRGTAPSGAGTGAGAQTHHGPETSRDHPHP